MNKKLVCAFSILLTLSCVKRPKVAQNKSNFVINLDIANTEDGQKAILRKQEGYLTISLDSTFIKNQKATFSGTIGSPAVYGIFIEGYKQGMFPIIEKGTININSNLKDLTSTRVTGTKLNKQLNTYKKKSRDISLKMNELFFLFQKARAENNSEKLAEINQQMKTINDEKNTFSVDFIKDNPKSFVSSMVLHSLLKNKDFPKDTVAQLYALLSDQVKKSEFSKEILLELEMLSLERDSIR